MAVLPVCLSPIISSRCPRPIGTNASTAFRPVCNGSSTGCRNITPGALRSNGSSIVSPTTGPRPSMGSPNVLTIRPSNPSPTRIDAMRPVRFTVWPSRTFSLSPRSTTPTLSSSRLSTTPRTPLSNSTSSLDSARSRPYIRAIPSPTSST